MRDQAYRKTYAHLIYGALLFCMRPDPTLYPIVLEGILGIADPSSIQYGAAALRQVRSTEQIVANLFALAEQRKNDLEVLSHIAWVFYWLGFTTEPSWRGGNCLGVDQCWAKLYREHTEPETDDHKIANIAPKVGAFMKAYYWNTQDEQQHAEGYARHPVQPGEFDGWEDEQVWI